MIEPLLLIKVLAGFYIVAGVTVALLRRLSFFLVSQEVYEVNEIWEWRDYMDNKEYDKSSIQCESFPVRVAIKLRAIEESSYRAFVIITPIVVFTLVGYLIYQASNNA